MNHTTQAARSTRVARKTSRGRRAALVALLALAATGLIAFGATPYGESVHAVSPGAFAFGDPLETLGPPSGEGMGVGTDETYSLGVGGSITIELGGGTFDQPGTDFIVFENPFTLIGTLNKNWIEAMFVEVSSDAISWARFENHYLGPPGPHLNGIGQDDVVPSTWFRGLAGVTPVYADPVSGADPFHVVEAGGDPFDLDELADHPAVLSGAVDISNISHVRLIDVHGGVALDNLGTPIWDCGGSGSANADLDALVSLNTAASLTPDRPFVTMEKRPDKVVEVKIWDADGIGDFKTRIALAINGVPVDFYALLHLFTLVATPTELTLRLGPIPDNFPLTELRLAVRDSVGQPAGDALHLP